MIVIDDPLPTGLIRLRTALFTESTATALLHPQHLSVFQPNSVVRPECVGPGFEKMIVSSVDS